MLLGLVLSGLQSLADLHSTRTVQAPTLGPHHGPHLCSFWGTPRVFPLYTLVLKTHPLTQQWSSSHLFYSMKSIPPLGILPQSLAQLLTLTSILGVLDCVVIMSSGQALRVLPCSWRAGLSQSRLQLFGTQQIALNRHFLNAYRHKSFSKVTEGRSKDLSPTDSWFVFKLPQITLLGEY